MSMYTHKGSLETSDDRPRNSRRIRRSQLFESENIATTESDMALKSNLGVPEGGRRQSGDSNSKSPARNRGKSKLIETMAANFEKKKSSDASIRSTPSAITQSKSIANGDAKPARQTEVVVDPPDDDPPQEKAKKSGTSARRGKQQREKRMLRQKRRSTGVVNPKDIEESEKQDADKKDNTEEEKQLQNETNTNTLTNEVAPASDPTSLSRVSVAKSEVSSVRTSKTNGTCETTQLIAHQTTYSSTKHLGSKPDETHAIKTTSTGNNEIEDLRLKLETAEVTISKLRKEIKAMDDELHALEEENHQLRKDNKMLEDENKTMLRLIRR